MSNRSTSVLLGGDRARVAMQSHSRLGIRIETDPVMHEIYELRQLSRSSKCKRTDLNDHDLLQDCDSVTRRRRGGSKQEKAEDRGQELMEPPGGAELPPASQPPLATPRRPTPAPQQMQEIADVMRKMLANERGDRST